MGIKLKKTAPAIWQGNGEGYGSACWGIVGHPNIDIYKTGGMWVAMDTADTVEPLHGQRLVRRLAAADTRSELVAQLEYRLEADHA